MKPPAPQTNAFFFIPLFSHESNRRGRSPADAASHSVGGVTLHEIARPETHEGTAFAAELLRASPDRETVPIPVDVRERRQARPQDDIEVLGRRITVVLFEPLCHRAEHMRQPAL